MLVSSSQPPSTRPGRRARRRGVATAISSSGPGPRPGCAAPARRRAPCAARRRRGRPARRARGSPLVDQVRSVEATQRGGARSRRRRPTMPARTAAHSAARLGASPCRVVVEEQQLLDRRVGADGGGDPPQPLGVAPDHRRVVERVADRGRAGSSSRERARASRGRGRQLGTPSRSASSAARPESPPEQVRTASPPRPAAAPAARPATRASSSSSCGVPAQAPPASSTRARNTRWSPASGAGVRRRGRGAGLRGPDLEHGDPDRPSAQRASAAASRAPSPSDSRNSATEPTPSRSHERREPVAGVEDRLVAGRDDRVEADPAARAERVDGDVAALGDHRHAAGLERRRPSPPQRRARATATIPLPFGPHTGSPPAAAASRSSRSSSRPASISPKPAASTTAPPQPRSAASAITAGTAGRGDRDDDGVDRLREVGDRRDARPPWTALAPRVHPLDLPVEAGALEVAQDVSA